MPYLIGVRRFESPRHDPERLLDNTKGHGVILAVNVLCVFTGMVAVFWRIRLNASWRTYARYTLTSALATLGLGLATMPLLNTAYTGLGERLALIPIELWFVVSGLLLWRSAGNRWDAS